MPKPSDEQQRALTQLLGFGSHSARKSHYPELLARLEELEAERNRYKWLFEHAVHGIFQASLQEGIRAANPALARMLGYETPEEALWALTDLSHHLFIGGEDELRQIRYTLSQQHGLFGYETRLRRRDGSAIYVLMNLLLKPDEDGLVEGFVADITERKLAQLRLLQLNEQLEQRVAERTCELRDARDAAEAANLSKDKYLAAASHDLLQPLNAARLLISTLRERKLPGEELNLVERAHQALEGAEDLLTDLLDISKLDQSAIKPDIDTYRLDEVLLPLVSEFQPVAAAAGLQLAHFIPAYAIQSDFRLLTRILRNFLSNACRYTEHGRVLLGARKRGAALRIEVWDTGAVFPPSRYSRSSSNSTNSTSSVPPSGAASAWAWRSSIVLPRCSTTASRCAHNRVAARSSVSRCRWPRRCRRARARCWAACRSWVIRCRGGACLCSTTNSASSTAWLRCSPSGAAKRSPQPTKPAPWKCCKGTRRS